MESVHFLPPRYFQGFQIKRALDANQQPDPQGVSIMRRKCYLPGKIQRTVRVSVLQDTQPSGPWG
jgi:hypothetical protein